MGLAMWETKSPSIEATLAYVYTCADFFAAPMRDPEGFKSWLKNLDLEYQEKAFDALANLFELFKINETILELWEDALLGNAKKQQPGITENGKALYLLQNLMEEYPGLYEVLKQLITKCRDKTCFVTKWYEDQATNDMHQKAIKRLNDIHQELKLLSDACEKLNNQVKDFLKKHRPADQNIAPKIQPIVDLQKILAEKDLDPLAKLIRCQQVFDNNADFLINPHLASSKELSKNKTHRKVSFYAIDITKDLHHLAREIQEILHSAKQAPASQPPAQQPVAKKPKK